MLRITVELVPGGRERAKRELARATLANVSGLAPKSNYEFEAREGDNQLAGTAAWESSGLIAGHFRHQSVWALVAKAAVWAAYQAEKRTCE